LTPFSRRDRTRRIAIALVAVLAAASCSGAEDERDATATTERQTTTDRDRDGGTQVEPLPTGLGDPLYPDLGAPGIDVEHYDVELDVDEDFVASGTVTLTIKATEDLAQVALDATALDVEEVTIDGEEVEFEVDDPELLVQPEDPIDEGTSFDVAVSYVDDPEIRESADKLGPGWIQADGYSYTLNEPEATRDWLPSLDHPSDKATWRFAITPPPGSIAIANGVSVSRPAEGEDGPWEWEMEDPMATYLVQVLVGDWVLIETTAPSGVQLSSAVLAGEEEERRPFVDEVDDQLAFFEAQFGPFPFDVYGVAVIDEEIGLAIEQQGRSLFSADAVASSVAAHELAHQWFGDAVTPDRWRDIWLAESFASYGEWLWEESKGGDTVDASAVEALVERDDEGPPTDDPTVEELFGFNVYEGGAVVVHALRREIGDEAFFGLLRRWITEYAGTSRRTEDFTALAADVAGRDLSEFFATWLEATDLPDALP